MGLFRNWWKCLEIRKGEKRDFAGFFFFYQNNRSFPSQPHQPSSPLPPTRSSGVREEVGCATRRVRCEKVGLLWREMAIYVAGNGVGRFDIFIALKASVTFSSKLND